MTEQRKFSLPLLQVGLTAAVLRAEHYFGMASHDAGKFEISFFQLLAGHHLRGGIIGENKIKTHRFRMTEFKERFRHQSKLCAVPRFLSHLLNGAGVQINIDNLHWGLDFTPECIAQLEALVLQHIEPAEVRADAPANGNQEQGKPTQNWLRGFILQRGHRKKLRLSPLE